MRDLLPEEMGRFRRVEACFRQTCEAWAYREVRTPIIEHLWLFTTAGTLTPQMLGRVYSFLDWDGWSGERVVLRPDATIGAARLYVEHLQNQPLAKLYYVQNVFRFADGDESREDWQCGAEIIGDTQHQGDIELALLGRDVLESLGLGPVQLRLSHPGIVRAVLARAGLVHGQQLELYDRILDGDLSAFREVQERLPQAGAAVRLLLGLEGAGSAYLANLRSAFLQAVPELARPLDELAMVAGALEELGCRCQIAAALVRNFEYYTGPAFHFLVQGEPVGGGGRYDSLIGLVSGQDRPASGFALDAGKLASLLSDGEEAAPPTSMMVRPATAQAGDLAAAFQAASALRQRGWLAQVLAAGDRESHSWHLTVGGGSFLLLKGGARRGRRYDSLEAVVVALESADA
jgi:histidyl-tRNA synthetase